MMRCRLSDAQAAALVVLLAALGSTAAAHTDVSEAQAQAMIASDGDLIVLDVRETYEFCGTKQHIEDAVLLSWSSGVLSTRFDELPADAAILVVCASGSRSHQAATFLDSQGYTDVYDILGGMTGWNGPTEVCGTTPSIDLVGVPSGIEVNWTPAVGVQDYDLLRGAVSNVSSDGVSVDLGPTTCLAQASPYTYHVDVEAPLPGEVLFYLTRQVGGDYGQSAAGEPRISSCE